MPTTVTVDAYTGIQMVAKKYDVMDGNQYRDFAKIYNINQGVAELTGWQGKRHRLARRIILTSQCQQSELQCNRR